MNVTHCWTNHGSIVEFRNQWYLLYHTDDLSGGIDARRSLAMELLHFNPDGTIEVCGVVVLCGVYCMCIACVLYVYCMSCMLYVLYGIYAVQCMCVVCQV